MFPSISDYISSIEGAADTLSTLNYLRPVRKPNGQPFFSSGNFAVVFKMEDTRNGGHIALKCFLRDVPDRARRLRLIGEWIADNPSPYLLPMTYHTNELWVDCAHSDREEFDVVMMPWVEGVTLGEYVEEILLATFNRPASLSFQFDKMAYWLLESSFSHGDLKPDNILVDERKNLKLIDYDGAYVPTLKFDDAMENGTPPYQHPNRDISYFDRHIDDFSILTLSLELHALAERRNLYVGGDSLILPAWFTKHPFNNDVWSGVRSLCSE